MAVFSHAPVLLPEVVNILAVKDGERVLDATVGLGGHAAAVLQSAPGAFLLGLDRDEAAAEAAGLRLGEFAGRFRVMRQKFSEFPLALEALGWDRVDAVLADLGVSSMQLDDPGRGFSFLADAPLDMRMGAGDGTAPASRLVNKASYEELRRVIAEYGEDPMAGRIARAIVKSRDARPIETTAQLAAVVEAAYPAKWRAKARNHPATRTFQALRMAVNHEAEELSLFLDQIVDYVRPGGRLAVISFHSIEDRMVKQAFRRQAASCVCPPGVLRCVCRGAARIELLTRKPLTPGEAEMAANPRSRSAKLRAARRLPEAA